jgi:hypothetical protein
MLRAARRAGASTQPIDRRRLALGVLVLAASATALSATEISGFSHMRARRPFLSTPHGFVTPREYQWSAEESRMRALRSSALVVGSSLAIASGALAQNAVQWRAEDGGNGHWYRLELTYAEWDQARLAAESVGGHLATITSAGENSFIQSLTSQAPPADYYLGGFRQNQSCDLAAWTWITGESFEFSAWGNWGYPEPNCVGWSCVSPGCGLVAEIIGRPDQGTNFGKWNDESKGIYWQGNLIAGQSIVEWSADCNSDGIVDYGQIRAGELVDTNGNNIPDCCEQGVDCRFTAVQWRVEDGGNGHWYKRTESWRTWDEAKNEAETVGGTLVTINSQAEGAYLAQHVAPSLNFWAGGRRVKGVWQWITGEPWDYTAWNCNHCHPSCQPDYPWEDHLEAMCFDGSTLRWNNYTSGNGRPAYVVEWSADCNSDGIVDYGQIRSGELADANGNYIPDCCESTPPCGPCLADVDGSGAVNGVDLAAILNTWGTSGGKYPGADVNSDGIVNGADLAEVLNSWGPCP